MHEQSCVESCLCVANLFGFLWKRGGLVWSVCGHCRATDPTPPLRYLSAPSSIALAARTPPNFTADVRNHTAHPVWTTQPGRWQAPLFLLGASNEQGYRCNGSTCRKLEANVRKRTCRTWRNQVCFVFFALSSVSCVLVFREHLALHAWISNGLRNFWTSMLPYGSFESKRERFATFCLLCPALFFFFFFWCFQCFSFKCQKN